MKTIILTILLLLISCNTTQKTTTIQPVRNKYTSFYDRVPTQGQAKRKAIEFSTINKR